MFSATRSMCSPLTLADFSPSRGHACSVVGAQNPPADTVAPNSELRPDWLQSVYGDTTLRTHRAALPAPPIPKLTGSGEVVEQMPLSDDRWWDATRTEAFVRSLSPMQRDRVAVMRRSSTVKYRTAYRRTANGSLAVWEVRPDDIFRMSGRTARGDHQAGGRSTAISVHRYVG